MEVSGSIYCKHRVEPTIPVKHGAAAHCPRRDIVGRMPRKQPR